MAKRGVRTEAGKRYYPDGSFYSGRNAGAAARELEYIDITLRENPPKRKRSREEILARRKKRRRQRRIAQMLMAGCILTMGIMLGFLLWKIIGFVQDRGVFNQAMDTERREIIRENDTIKPVITEDFLTVNPYSRPAEPLDGVKNIFVHYTANKNTSARQNRSYFENLGITGETSASAHFIIGYDGEIIQCLPLDEIGYAVKTRNYDSISIECCYRDDSGKFTDATYQSLLQLTAWLLKEYKLAPNDVLRHYDVGGKKCPLYFVEHEDSWEQFRQDLTDYILEK
ncbi:N-acetylmuramoyl-L-alanine amidase [Lachnospiraceae bacterium NLAE-zl-G231]|nr:hypothetical protein CE91St58_25150 [Lachnospiraceae bacterium]SFH46495.1 N-acetylmuramoyl-L-alanine amidase [Lachnospiraceae bacterium NLAE-zl-G231]